MKKIISTIIIIIFILPFFANAAEKGSVYLGPFLSVIWYEPSKKPYLTIGEFGPFKFENDGQISKLIIDDLDLGQIYKVKVHYDKKVVESWDLNFDKIKSDIVCIWRAKGSWRMEPYEKSRCQCQKMQTCRLTDCIHNTSNTINL
jgi:hypothetical protein